MELRLYLIVAMVMLSTLIAAQSVIIGGTVFIDKNDNGLKDSDEIELGILAKQLSWIC